MAVLIDDVMKDFSSERQKRIKEGMAEELAEYEASQDPRIIESSSQL